MCERASLCVTLSAKVLIAGTVKEHVSRPLTQNLFNANDLPCWTAVCKFYPRVPLQTMQAWGLLLSMWELSYTTMAVPQLVSSTADPGAAYFWQRFHMPEQLSFPPDPPVPNQHLPRHHLLGDGGGGAEEIGQE